MGYDTRRRSAASGSRNCKPKKRAAMASRRHGRAANVATNHGNRFHAKKYVGNVEGIFFLRSSAAEIIDSKETVSQPSPRARRALEADYHRNEGSYGKYSFHLFDVFFIAESFRLVRFPRLPEVSMESRKKIGNLTMACLFGPPRDSYRRFTRLEPFGPNGHRYRKSTDRSLPSEMHKCLLQRVPVLFCLP